MAVLLRRALVLMCVHLTTVTLLETDTTSNFRPYVIQVKEEFEGSQLSEKTPKENRTISIIGNDFILDGRRFRIMSGSLHYFRVPAEYWRDRLRKFKAAGLNTVSTYVEWSSHEPEEGQLRFEGDQDIGEFIRIAAEEGLLVLLRPGPYICAERDLGGLPYWLLSKYPNIRLRSTDTDFMQETKSWMAKLFRVVKPLLYANGGPIIMVQVENEYGSYGADKSYMAQVRDVMLEHVGSAALLYTTDGSSRSYFRDGSISNALTTIDFGPVSSVNDTFKALREYMPIGPLMNSEFYPGWLTHWGESIQQVATDSVVRTLQDMLDNNINFNIYMFFGGSNFEFTSGANYGSFYQPDITSYDYDAPLTEAGDPSPKYTAIRNILTRYNSDTAKLPEPVPSRKSAYGKILMSPKLRLLSPEGRSALGVRYKNVIGANLPTFEALRQRGGLVLYETTVSERDGVLQITKPRDWVFVYVDDVLQGVINRMQKLYRLSIKCNPGSRLSLLVENQGRINFGHRLHDFKGILSPVILNNKSLDVSWTITGFPLNLTKDYQYSCNGEIARLQPVLFEGRLTLPAGENPTDTFIDPTGWGKGYIFVNGHNLGRYWPGVGPQVTLYVPGVWLLKAPAQNIIQVVELQGTTNDRSLDSIDYSILNRTGSLLQYIMYP